MRHGAVRDRSAHCPYALDSRCSDGAGRFAGSPAWLAPAAIENLELVAFVGGEERGDMTQAFRKRGRGEQRILALAQVVILKVQREREHVDGKRVGKGGLLVIFARAFVDAAGG